MSLDWTCVAERGEFDVIVYTRAFKLRRGVVLPDEAAFSCEIVKRDGSPGIEAAMLTLDDLLAFLREVQAPVLAIGCLPTEDMPMLDAMIRRLGKPRHVIALH
jgi:hypothetical protein